MEIRELNIEEIKFIFQEHITHDFPLAEQRPLKNILALKRKQHYYCFGLYDDELLGYAFFAGDVNKNVLLLDYFAIVKGKRSSGYGSIFLDLLKERLKDYLVIAEVESLHSAPNLKEKEIRQRRINFYLENNFKESDITCRLFGVHYQMLYLNKVTINNQLFYQHLKDLYLSIFNYIIYLIFIKIKKEV